MRIEVDSVLFEQDSADVDLDLYHLFRLAWSQRHILLTKPVFGTPGDEAVQAWLANRAPKHLQDILRDILEIDVERAASDVSRTTLTVELIDEPMWSSNQHQPHHRVPLQLACRIASTPLRLLVENRRNDGAFLRACAPPEARERLDEALEQGWVEFENAGGVGEMLHRVEEATANGRESDALRLWVLHDSDARARYDLDSGATVHDDGPKRWGPSPDSDAIQAACRASNVPLFHHRLRRRAIENYVPGRLLQHWSGLRDRKSRRKAVSKFLGLNEEQRHFFNMKKGLEGDRSSSRGLAPIYADLSTETDDHLARGFAGIADFFHERDFPLDPDWFVDGQQDEIRPLVESIFERM